MSVSHNGANKTPSDVLFIFCKDREKKTICKYRCHFFLSYFVILLFFLNFALQYLYII